MGHLNFAETGHYYFALTSQRRGSGVMTKGDGLSVDSVRHGILLNVENYDACVSFYQTVFDLPLMHQSVEGSFRLSCLEYGNCYLMIETGGTASPSGKSLLECPTKFRFNVVDLEAALAKLKKFGIDAEITKNNWGSTINIFDPDGNRIGIRDEASFGGKAVVIQEN